jgi:hypothetical protein
MHYQNFFSMIQMARLFYCNRCLKVRKHDGQVSNVSFTVSLLLSTREYTCKWQFQSHKTLHKEAFACTTAAKPYLTPTYTQLMLNNKKRHKRPETYMKFSNKCTHFESVKETYLYPTLTSDKLFWQDLYWTLQNIKLKDHC